MRVGGFPPRVRRRGARNGCLHELRRAWMRALLVLDDPPYHATCLGRLDTVVKYLDSRTQRRRRRMRVRAEVVSACG